MISKMIIDADICIKLGGSDKYRYLYDILPLVSSKIYMHEHAHNEVMLPSSAVRQLNDLIKEKKVILVNENSLSDIEKAVYQASVKKLSSVMIDPRRPNKNKGEVCSLAYAKATNIPYFATDERDLQPIIDSQLNVGINDISCIRIIDIVYMIRDGKIEISRKVTKAMWYLTGKSKEYFDTVVWPI